MSDRKSLVLLSGGIDSAVVLAQEVAAGRKPLCLSFDYGQLHAARELQAARRIAGHYGCEWLLLTLPPDVLGGSALTGEKPLPTGLPAAHRDQAATVVPNRNMVLLAVAGSHAARRGIGRVLYGANRGDAAVYADCRSPFVDEVSWAMLSACGVAVEVPLFHLDKAGVVAEGRRLGVPLELTWSCYAGGPEPCGVCGACVARREAGA